MALVVGPVWAEPGQADMSVLNPLRVENPMFSTVERFLSGVISTTPHARYLGLHGLVRAETQRRDLDLEASYELVRRCEAVVAAVAHHHAAHKVWLPAAHGEGKIPAFLDSEGGLDVVRAATPGGYSEAKSGFYGTYRGPEQVLGIVALGGGQDPGERYDDTAVRGPLGAVLELAGQDHVSGEQLRRSVHLCPCAAEGDEAAWLRTIVCGTAGGDSFAAADEARLDTARIVARVVSAAGTVTALQRTLQDAVAFGPPLEQGPLAGIDLAHGWRGLILRNVSVGAWRNLWWWLVRQLNEPHTPGDLGDALVAELPADWTVADLTDQLPPTTDGADLLPVERQLRQAEPRPHPLTELRLIALGARRLDDLDGRAHTVLAGEDQDDLGPVWVADELAAASGRPLRNWAAELSERLLWRSHRIALTKLDLRDPLRPRLPAQVVERDGRWHKNAEAGWGEVGLRLPSFTSMLVGCGVLGADARGTWLTANGEVFRD